MPQQVIAGLAQLSVVRVDEVSDFDPHTLLPVEAERHYESNRVTLPGGVDYVVVGSYGVVAGDVIPEIDVFTQGNPFAADPASALQLVAQIPVGVGWNEGGRGGVRSTALTADNTRAYGTLTWEGSVAVVDMLALQEADADPNCSCPGHVDQIKLPDGAQPFWIALDKTNTHAYVSDRQDYGGKGRIYVIDIDPRSPDFHRADRIRTIEVDGAGEGLRQLIVSDDGMRLYVAAPNRDEVSAFRLNAGDLDHSLLDVVNIDPHDVPTSPDKNPARYEQQIARFDTGQETYAVQTTGDPTRVLITNRHLDGDGVQALTVTNNTSQAFSGSIDQVTELTLGSLFDTFDVNDGEGLLVLPKDALDGRDDPVRAARAAPRVHLRRRLRPLHLRRRVARPGRLPERDGRVRAHAGREQRRDHPRREARRRDVPDPGRLGRQPRVRERPQLPLRVVPGRRDGRGLGRRLRLQPRQPRLGGGARPPDARRDVEAPALSGRSPGQRTTCCRSRRTCRGSTPASTSRPTTGSCSYNDDAARILFGVPARDGRRRPLRRRQRQRLSTTSATARASSSIPTQRQRPRASRSARATRCRCCRRAPRSRSAATRAA